jgi:hypothetical protein
MSKNQTIYDYISDLVYFEEIEELKSIYQTSKVSIDGAKPKKINLDIIQEGNTPFIFYALDHCELPQLNRRL